MGGGLHAALEALAAGALLVEAGDADRVVVVAVDHAGPATWALAGDAISTGAVAVLLSSSPRNALARVGGLEIVRGRPSPERTPAGHAALLALVRRPGAWGPCELTCASPPDALARVRLERV